MLNQFKPNAIVLIKKLPILILGALFYAVGVNIFLVPTGLFDNGTTGISVITYYLTEFNLSIIFICVTLPFWILGTKIVGKLFGFLHIFALLSLSAWTALLGLFKEMGLPILTDDLLLAAIFGGVTIGLGCGMIIRTGGTIDGIEILSVILNRKIKLFSIGQYAFAFNFFIFLTAGIIFGADRFMYSVISFFITMKIMDIIINGFNTLKNIMIISERHKEISRTLVHELGKGVTILSGQGGFSEKEKNVLYVVATRLELSKIKEVVLKCDDRAFIIINDVYEVSGGKVSK